jgi:hypothetical protein
MPAANVASCLLWSTVPVSMLQLQHKACGSGPEWKQKLCSAVHPAGWLAQPEAGAEC